MKKVIDFFSTSTLITFIVISISMSIFITIAYLTTPEIPSYGIFFLVISIIASYFAIVGIIIDLVFGLTNFYLKWMSKKAKRIEKILKDTNPDAVNPEDVAKFFFIPKWAAKGLLKMGVKDNNFIENEDGTFKFVKK